MAHMSVCVCYVARVRWDGRDPGVSHELRTCVRQWREQLRQRVLAVCGKTVGHIHVHTNSWSTVIVFIYDIIAFVSFSGKPNLTF